MGQADKDTAAGAGAAATLDETIMSEFQRKRRAEGPSGQRAIPNLNLMSRRALYFRLTDSRFIGIVGPYAPTTGVWTTRKSARC